MLLSRRQFLKRTGIAAGGATLGGLVSLGVDPEPVQAAMRPLAWKIQNTKQVPSVCPYCAVGCGQILHVRDGTLVNVEGNPDSPISRGNLCPKGAASFQLTVNPERQTKALYRRPGGRTWEPIDVEKAMDLIAQRVKHTRDTTFQISARPAGLDHDVTVNNTLAIASLGGATLDNEWNYAQAKLFRGLGGVFIENQARI
ncbi:MAG: twin-arginine translocation signal domain-containing protein [Gemmatimonadota bacterium]|nr:twin-arginine translocation signal domain-containing protein [Gemmatimonadota bacterium]